jgi:hypothetical protein
MKIGSLVECVDDCPGWRTGKLPPFRKGDVLTVWAMDEWPIDGVLALHVAFSNDSDMWSATRFREVDPAEKQVAESLSDEQQ